MEGAPGSMSLDQRQAQILSQVHNILSPSPHSLPASTSCLSSSAVAKLDGVLGGDLAAAWGTVPTSWIAFDWPPKISRRNSSRRAEAAQRIPGPYRVDHLGRPNLLHLDEPRSDTRHTRPPPGLAVSSPHQRLPAHDILKAIDTNARTRSGIFSHRAG
jgi:hypothetical protein